MANAYFDCPNNHGMFIPFNGKITICIIDNDNKELVKRGTTVTRPEPSNVWLTERRGLIAVLESICRKSISHHAVKTPLLFFFRQIDSTTVRSPVTTPLKISLKLITWNV